ncbi:hypothetical protein PMAYCL1PPCAC_01671 [Pristionchus mayeri]|uniref:Uncharacterized protein n=1 Tax=Pristionchus mayeri TaxID=1317129 RepID=A0AAN5C7M4_9BILA|nr:hypothetical protein PMAYCL1PPCAC_01671 [Pristionchus mayeri]
MMSVIFDLRDNSSHLGETDNRAFSASHLQANEGVIVGGRRGGLAQSRLVGRQRQGYGKSRLERLLLGHGEGQLGGNTSGRGGTLAREVHLWKDLGQVSLHVRLLSLHDQLVEGDEGNGHGEDDTRGNSGASNDGHCILCRFFVDQRSEMVLELLGQLESVCEWWREEVRV